MLTRPYKPKLNAALTNEIDQDISKSHPGADTGGGLQGMHPPTRPEKLLTWYSISFKIITKSIKNWLMLTISQKRFFVSLDELALFVEPDIK